MMRVATAADYWCAWSRRTYFPGQNDPRFRHLIKTYQLWLTTREFIHHPSGRSVCAPLCEDHKSVVERVRLVSPVWHDNIVVPITLDKPLPLRLFQPRAFIFPTHVCTTLRTLSFSTSANVRSSCYALSNRPLYDLRTRSAWFHGRWHHFFPHSVSPHRTFLRRRIGRLGSPRHLL